MFMTSLSNSSIHLRICGQIMLKEEGLDQSLDRCGGGNDYNRNKGFTPLWKKYKFSCAFSSRR